jgi:DnaK suppressor protein
MTTKETQSKAILEQERQRTLAEIGRLRRYMEDGVEERIVDSGEDSVDAAADVYEREKTLAIIRTLDNKLVAIERAIRATEKGSYGICEMCGLPIAPARLEFMPQTTTCVKCQERLERMPRYKPRPTISREDE